MPSHEAKSRGPLWVARTIWRFCTSPTYRNYAILRWRRPPELFQLSSVTRDNRYPHLFEFARNELGDHAGLRLLSFGCSTGEEVFTLRRYFPQASLKGIDINAASIARCRQQLRSHPDAAIGFEVAGTAAREAAQSCNAVFCMAVFRDGALADPKFDRCDPLITFARFSAAMDDLSRCLKPGGLLFIAHANFRFEDTPAAGQFDLAHRSHFPRDIARATPLFDTSNRRTAEVEGEHAVFRKKLLVGAD